MGAEHQNLYQHGSAAWTARFYKEKTLTALTVDLAGHAFNGIPPNVCEKVYTALNQSVAIVEGIQDGSFFHMHFHESLAEFRDEYFKWNGVDNQRDRSQTQKVLCRLRTAIFARFNREMDNLRKNKKYAERDMQFEILSRTDKEMMDNLNRTFSQLVAEHGDLFPSLKGVIAKFNR